MALKSRRQIHQDVGKSVINVPTVVRVSLEAEVNLDHVNNSAVHKDVQVSQEKPAETAGK